MSDELSEEARKAIDKIEKLLRLAANNNNEAEAANATARAQELLIAYNLDMGMVERNSGDTGKRADELLVGGYFEWQRDLWEAVARLNFCLYWSQIAFIEMPGGKITKYKRRESVVDDGRVGTHAYYLAKGINQHQHRVVGRTVNIAATRAMATYLESVVDRLTKERCRAAKIVTTSRWATSYREGITQRVTERIYAERRKFICEEERRARDAEIEAKVKMREGVSLETAISVASFAKSEDDANIDIRFGEGTAAQWAAERAAKAHADRLADEAYTKWAAAHPKEAARDEEVRRKKREREANKKQRDREYKGDWGAYTAGYEKGESVSLNRQAESTKVAGLIR